MKSGLVLGAFGALALLTASPAFPQGEAVQDLNGDGQVGFLAFGDSITAGLGDGIEPGVAVFDYQGRPIGPGYPGRVNLWGGIQTQNEGLPGEELVVSGVYRFPGTLAASNADLVGIMEGSNDAIHLIDSGSYRSMLQKMVNVAWALGKQPVMLTLPIPCCGHQGSAPFVRSYSQVAREVAAVNQLLIADIEAAWQTTCDEVSECYLLNLPEGLHPNRVGYDVIGQTVLATLFGIDIFSATGAADLESALGLAAGTVVVKPRPAA